MITSYFVIDLLPLTYTFPFLELLQKTEIVFVKEPNVIDAIPNHGDALDAEAKGPAGPDFRVVADVFKDLGMHHAAAGDFQPFLAHFARQRTAEINLEARFGVTEIMWTETNPGFGSHQFFEDEFHCPLQIAHRHVAIHIQSLDLMERWIVRRVGVISAVNPAGHKNAHRWLLLLHHP